MPELLPSQRTNFQFPHFAIKPLEFFSNGFFTQTESVEFMTCLFIRKLLFIMILLFFQTTIDVYRSVTLENLLLYTVCARMELTSREEPFLLNLRQKEKSV